MKLLFCLFRYFPYGGLQRDCVRIAKACMDAGDTVEVITHTWEGPHIPGITVHCFPVRAWTNHQGCEKFSRLVQDFIKNHDYDGVIGFNKMPDLDIYYTADPCYRDKSRGLRSKLPRDRIYLKLEEAVFSSAQKTHIFLINPDQQAIFARYYGTQSERFHVLPPGIAPDRNVASKAKSERDVLRQQQGISQQTKVLLFLASSFKTKGLDRALNAIASLPEFMRQHVQLWIVGQDHLAPYEKLIKRLKLIDQIKFLGSSDRVPELLMSADLLLHPAYNEVTGTVLLEALVAGLPVLTTGVCGYAHYVKESQAGIVLPEPFSQPQLNAALSELLSEDKLKTLREKADIYSQTADVYSMPSVAVKLIHQILS